MILYFIVFLLLFFVENLYFRIARHYKIIDKPNERSSHHKITLRGGGIIFYVSILFFFLFNPHQYDWFFVGLTIIMLISFLDDIKPRSFQIRLLFHLMAVILLMGQIVEWMDLPWWWILIFIISTIGFINIYNFMDGINGITSGYSFIVLLFVWYSSQFLYPFIDMHLIYFFGLALIVFSFYNFRTHARCFAGDVGSVTAGYIISFLLIILIVQSKNIGMLTLVSVYLVDAGMTMMHRLFKRENIFKAHRSHLYQLLSNELKQPHLKVSLGYMFLQGIISAGFILLKNYGTAYFIFVFIFLILLYSIMLQRIKKIISQKYPSRVIHANL